MVQNIPECKYDRMLQVVIDVCTSVPVTTFSRQSEFLKNLKRLVIQNLALIWSNLHSVNTDKTNILSHKFKLHSLSEVA